MKKVLKTWMLYNLAIIVFFFLVSLVYILINYSLLLTLLIIIFILTGFLAYDDNRYKP